jgi:hypothetical protein
MSALVSYIHDMSTVAGVDFRSIKREIGHLCHDEQRPPKTGGKQTSDAVQTTSSNSVDPSRSISRAGIMI